MVEYSCDCCKKRVGTAEFTKVHIGQEIHLCGTCLMDIRGALVNSDKPVRILFQNRDKEFRIGFGDPK